MRQVTEVVTLFLSSLVGQRRLLHEPHLEAWPMLRRRAGADFVDGEGQVLLRVLEDPRQEYPFALHLDCLTLLPLEGDPALVSVGHLALNVGTAQRAQFCPPQIEREVFNHV